MKTDLHKAKKSHMSVPVTRGIEIPMQQKDLKGQKFKVGQKAHVKIPMEVTSADSGHTRMKQISKLKIEKQIKKIARRVM